MHGTHNSRVRASRYKLVFLSVFFLAVIALAAGCGGGPAVTFTGGEDAVTLDVEVASTPAAVEKGLVGRESLPADEGMLFDFGGNTKTPFWMKDVSIPLSIAFIDADGKVLGIKDMEPGDTTLVEPPGEYYYAVEVNQGWFSENGVKAGDRAKIRE